MTKQISIACISTDWNINEYRDKHNLYGGVGYYRIFKPYKELEKLGYKVDFYNREFKDEANKFKDTTEFWVQFVKRYDIIITKAVDNPLASASLCFFAHHFGKKVLLDLDDNFFEVNPENKPAWEAYHAGTQKKAFLTAYMAEVDGIICSTKPLADYYHKYLKERQNVDIPCYLFPNFNDIEEWPENKKSKKLTIGWAGSTSHDADLKLIMPSLNRILKEYPEVRLELMGGLTTETAPKILAYFEPECLDRIAIQGGTLAWKGYPEHLMKRKYDIGLAPLLNEEFNRGKSHIKWMEYAMGKIPCVASKVYPYYQPIGELETIIDGETGLLAIDGLDFYKKIKFLLDNKEERERIGQNAYNAVKNNWQWKDNILKLKNIIDNI